MKRLMLTTAMGMALAGTAMAQATVDPMLEATPESMQAEVRGTEGPVDVGTRTQSEMAEDGVAIDEMAAEDMAAEEMEMDAAEPVVAEPAPLGSAMTEPAMGETMDQTMDQTVATPMDTQGLQVPGFLASNFEGMSLYVVDPEGLGMDATVADARWNSGETVLGMRDSWEDVGGINDTVLSQDGQVRGVLVDVGGFLGIGSRTVLVDLADIYFVPDSETAEDLSDFYAVAGLSRAQLEALPEWDEENLVAGYPWQGMPVAREEAMAPMATDVPMAGDSPDMVPDEAVVSADTADTPGAMPTAEELIGASVVDGTGDSIGNVEDVLLDEAMVSALIIDVGGFLGIGARTVALPFDGLSVVRNVDTGNVDHVQTALTREELEAMPVFER